MVDHVGGMPIVAFWHEYEEDGYLSNWYGASFDFCGRHFATSEHYLMWQKARVFGDADNATKVLLAHTPKDAKDLGKKVSPFDGRLWSAVSEQLALYGIRQKFIQNIRLRDALLSTAPSVLVEASPYDQVWGIGMTADDPRIANPARWKGKNLLGRILMRVRSNLMSFDSSSAHWGDEAVEELLESDLGAMTLQQLACIPATRSCATTYVLVARHHLGKDYLPLDTFLTELASPLVELDDAVDYGSGGTLPSGGWRETLSELAFIRRCGL